LKGRLSLTDIENILYHLNYRWKMEVLALWKGDKVPFETYRIYEGYESFISLDTLSRIDQFEPGTSTTRLKHALIDHYLQRELLPHESEMRSWMRGAVAHVNGKKIYFRDIIPWCQKGSTYEERQILQRETGALCKFLKPFALNYWNILLGILREELGFETYLDYCRVKKGIDYRSYYEAIKDLLEQTEQMYFQAMEAWLQQSFGLPVGELTRFDAIHLLGLGHFDVFFPQRKVEDLKSFFACWKIDLDQTPGLYLELGSEAGKSAQAMCFILQVPEEVYILMKPEGGWVDLETLYHELGHGLSAVFTSPDLEMVDRDMATSFSLSESFAFLLQNIGISPPFLDEYLGLKPEDSETLYYYKVLRDLSVFRRYGAKFISEFEMFSRGDISDGRPYAELMTRYTGFIYQPESHLFDLAPEFYSLDYILGWWAEAAMEEYLRERNGSQWMFNPKTENILKRWWEQGNRYDVEQFMERNGLGRLSAERLMTRWKRVLS